MRKELRQEIELKLYSYSSLKDAQWGRLIGKVLEELPDQMRQLACMRYIERQSEREICSSLHIERAAYYNWVNRIINEVAIAAAYERLIEP
ncbi:MAG: DUF1492 domain-containing protein [Lentihominibacter sp.]